MELFLKTLAEYVALAAELCSVVCIALGMVETLARTTMVIGRHQLVVRRSRRQVFVGFAVWIVLALEFALAADIVRTAIAPTWDDIGHLAAIAVIRTALNYFLERDMAEFNPDDAEPESVG